MGLELALFGLLALLAILSAAMMILQQNAVHSALFLVLNFACVALLFLMLDAPFISMVQIAVYAGAIMVLFLFVIMLLGAEQTTDADARRFRWVNTVATVLAVSVLIAMASPLVISGGLDLPEAPGDDPLVRLVHTANVDTTVTASITQGDETISVPEIADFGDVSSFVTIDAGEAQLVLSDEAGNSVFSTTFETSLDDVLTVILHGAQTPAITVVENNLGTTEANQARVHVLNLYSEEPLQLVNLGANRQLDTGADGITDMILAEVPFGEPLEPLTLREANYNLGFYRQLADGTWERVGNLASPERNDGAWIVEEATEQFWLLVPDYAAPQDPAFGYRPRILDTAQEELALTVMEPFGAPGDIGRDLFTTYLLPVNLVGFLLLVALIGVIVLTRPQGVGDKPRRSTVNRRRKVSRPLVSVISQQTGGDVAVDTPRLDQPDSGN